MRIKESELYKYLDIVLVDSSPSEANSSKNILYENYLNPVSSEEREEYFEICEQVVNVGVKLGYFKYISKETDWFDLTEKGIIARSKGGHSHYLNYIEQKDKEKLKPTIITENYIAGNNLGIQSSKSNFHKPIIHHKTADKKTSILEKVSWIVGIIGGCIVIYEFFIKK